MSQNLSHKLKSEKNVLHNICMMRITDSLNQTVKKKLFTQEIQIKFDIITRKLFQE